MYNGLFKMLIILPPLAFGEILWSYQHDPFQDRDSMTDKDSVPLTSAPHTSILTTT